MASDPRVGIEANIYESYSFFLSSVIEIKIDSDLPGCK